MAKVKPNDIKISTNSKKLQAAKFRGDNFDINAQCDNCWRLYFNGASQCNVPMCRGSSHTDWAAMNKILSLTQSFPVSDWTKHFENIGAELDGLGGNNIIHRASKNTIIIQPVSNLKLDCPFYKAHPLWLPNWLWLKTFFRAMHFR